MKEPTRFNKFLGGRNLIFLLSVLILIGITIFIYTKISFIFHPLIVILSTVAPPAIIAFIIFYLMNPIVNLLEKIRIKRLRSEEHTSELQSRFDLVCRLLLEKKKRIYTATITILYI